MHIAFFVEKSVVCVVEHAPFVVDHAVFLVGGKVDKVCASTSTPGDEGGILIVEGIYFFLEVAYNGGLDGKPAFSHHFFRGLFIDPLRLGKNAGGFIGNHVGHVGRVGGGGVFFGKKRDRDLGVVVRLLGGEVAGLGHGPKHHFFAFCGAGIFY